MLWTYVPMVFRVEYQTVPYHRMGARPRPAETTQGFVPRHRTRRVRPSGLSIDGRVTRRE